MSDLSKSVSAPKPHLQQFTEEHYETSSFIADSRGNTFENCMAQLNEARMILDGEIEAPPNRALELTESAISYARLYSRINPTEYGSMATHVFIQSYDVLVKILRTTPEVFGSEWDPYFIDSLYRPENAGLELLYQALTQNKNQPLSFERISRPNYNDPIIIAINQINEGKDLDPMHETRLVGNIYQRLSNEALFEAIYGLILKRNLQTITKPNSEFIPRVEYLVTTIKSKNFSVLKPVLELLKRSPYSADPLFSQIASGLTMDYMASEKYWIEFADYIEQKRVRQFPTHSV
jgi:hypothetical protein